MAVTGGTTHQSGPDPAAPGSRSDPPALAGASTEQLLDAAPDALVITDDRGTIRLVNHQAEVLFGYQRADLVGQSVEILVPDRFASVHPGHRAGYYRHPATRPMGAGLELAARRKNGSEFPVDISLSALETAEGTLVSAAVRDITDRKRADAHRTALEDRLHRARLEEERAANEARMHQVQRLESIGQLAGGVAHDFNNLLAAIMNYTALITHELARLGGRTGVREDPDFTTIVGDVEGIQAVATQASDLTRQLLIFSRRDVIRPEVLDLNDVVTQTERLLRRTLGEDVDLGTHLAEDLPNIQADRGQVEQVLMNLAVNARDAMGPGGILRIETRPFEADEDYATSHGVAPGLYAQISVSDTGAGMTPEVAQRAFEPFFTTKAQGMGTGLGLATVYGIATQSGGDVALYSAAGIGTTVRVNFPATGETPAAKAPPSAREELDGHETILLVEDAASVRDPTRRILEEHGYQALSAANADEALDVARTHTSPIHLLLTDIVMPGRSGKELAAEMAVLSPSTLVLYMSGYSYDVIAHQGALGPGGHFLEKPFPADLLLRRMRAILDGR